MMWCFSRKSSFKLVAQVLTEKLDLNYLQILAEKRYSVSPTSPTSFSKLIPQVLTEKRGTLHHILVCIAK